MLEGFIFDLDGTLINDALSWKTSLKLTCRFIMSKSAKSLRSDMIYDEYQQVSDYMWNNYNDCLAHLKSNQDKRLHVWERTLRNLGLAHGDALLEEIVEYYSRQRSITIYPFANAKELLQKISDYGIKIAICTDGEECVQKNKLIKLDLYQYVSYCVCGIDINHRKPDYILYKKCIDFFGCSPNKLLYVGDDYDRDYLPAKTADMNAVLVNHPSPESCTLETLYQNIEEIIFHGKYKL